MDTLQKSSGTNRARWAAIGAAVAVSIGAGGLATVSAGLSEGERTVYVPIAPCRIMDTRAGVDNVGDRSTPLGVEETYVVEAHGTNGNCTLPADAAGLSLNVTAVAASELTFLTVWPSDQERPKASSLNPAPGDGPVPNAVVTDLSVDGAFSVFNRKGTIEVIVDVNGYYVDHDHDDRYYTEEETDAALEAKANAADVYSADEVDAALEVKADQDEVILGLQEFGAAVQVALAAKADVDDTLWAVVANDGTLVRSSAGVAGSGLFGGGVVGDYIVMFDRNISGCAYQATAGRPGVDQNPAAGYAQVANYVVNPSNGVVVFTRDTNGNGVENRGFHLLVTC